MPSAPEAEVEKIIASFDKLRHADGTYMVAQLRERLQRTMQAHASVFRNDKSCRKAAIKYAPSGRIVSKWLCEIAP